VILVDLVTIALSATQGHISAEMAFISPHFYEFSHSLKVLLFSVAYAVDAFIPPSVNAIGNSSVS
jgi:hypothetical protein